MIVNASRRQAAALLGVLLLALPGAWAQQGPPHLGYVYPAGGRQGTTFDVQIGGRSLDGVTDVSVSGGGAEAKVIEQDKPLTQQQINALREKLRELAKKERDAATLKEMAEIRDRISTSLRRLANPALAEIVCVQMTIAPDAGLGERELRLATPLGLSNPLIFRVGSLPEVSEKDLETSAADAEMVVALPVTVNGRIVPGDTAKTLFPARQGEQFQKADVDRYRFEARRGQQLIVAARARELIPYLADAVPGWFQAVVTLYDVQGKELAYDDDYRFHPDPVLHYVIPANGAYILEIKDAIYRGREDFVYRVTLGELPFVTGIFPLGGPAGAATTVDLNGWNLPMTRVTAQGKDSGKCDLRSVIVDLENHQSSINNPQFFFNPVSFAVDTLPECLEKESNDSPQGAQAVRLPIIVNGRIDQSGDWDVFRFAGRAGEQIVAEVHARRLDSPLDSVLKLTDAAGRQLAFNDDHEDKGSGLNTHHADSLILATLPEEGTYCIHLGDAQRQGGAEYAYRLRLSAPRPDFELRICPSALNAGPGQTIPVDIYALRQDGFSGDITLALQGVPRTFVLSGGVVPGGQNHVQATLTLPPTPRPDPVSLHLEGRATIQGREQVRQAVPADDMMQAFAYRHLVPAQDLTVTTIRRAAVRTPAAILSDLPVKIPLGGTVQVRVTLPAARFLEKVRFELSEPPEGITVENTPSDRQADQKVTVSPRRNSALVVPTDFVLKSDAAKTKSGLRGNLIVEVSGERAPGAGAGKAKAKANRQRIPLGVPPMSITGVSPVGSMAKPCARASGVPVPLPTGDAEEASALVG